MPKQGKKPIESTDASNPVEDEDFFDEISSQLDNLKRPATDSKQAGRGGQPAGRPSDPDSTQKAPVKKASPHKPAPPKRLSNQSAKPSTDKKEKKASVPKPKPTAKKRKSTPKKHRQPPSKKPGLSAEDFIEDGRDVDYDDFLADVSADIDNVKDRFEGTDGEASEIVEYELDEWFLPEEKEHTETSETVASAKAIPEKKKAPVRAEKKGKPPKAKKKPAPPESTSEKPKKQLKTIPSPSAVNKPKPVSKRPLKRKSRSSAGDAKAKVPKPPKPPVKARAKGAPIPHLEDLEAVYEDAIAQHLVKETPSRFSRRISTKLLLGGAFTIVLMLAAGFLVVKDPFGLFTSDSASTSVAQKTPAAPAAPTPVHKVPLPPSPTPETPPPKAVQGPQPGPQTTSAVSRPPPAGNRTSVRFDATIALSGGTIQPTTSGSEGTGPSAWPDYRGSTSGGSPGNPNPASGVC